MDSIAAALLLDQSNSLASSGTVIQLPSVKVGMVVTLMEIKPEVIISGTTRFKRLMIKVIIIILHRSETHTKSKDLKDITCTLITINVSGCPKELLDLKVSSASKELNEKSKEIAK